MGQQGQSDARRFAAFVSYSHADASAAAALQRRLERYRLPKHIVGDAGGTRTELGPIFRDREDLAAAPSLSAAIRDAIARADALLVICSPEAKASNWVDQEIALFRSLHPDRPILAALVTGDPGTAFPAALTADGVEPLAADLREGGDGPQLGFLKIVAGIAGVPLDALIQRDAQRRLRRVTAITVGALAAMLIMAIMTTFAISARNEANRQRAEAEGLVEYMLTDLREKLKGVGRIDVMSAVNERAMDHYKSQGDLASLPADSLERRARLLHAMGEDDVNSGQLDGAQRKFEEARRTTAALLAKAPHNADRIFAHAQSEFYSGLIAWQREDRATTTRHWQAYRTYAGQLAGVEPRSERSLMELGYAEGNLCELDWTDGHDLDGASKHCSNAIDFETEALLAAPGDRKIIQDLANRHGWMAQVREAQQDFGGAVASRRDEAALMDRLLAADPQNVEYAVRRSWVDLGLAQIRIEQSDPAAALVILDRAIARAPQLLSAVPQDNRVNNTQAKIWFLRAKAQRLMHRNAAASLAKAEAAGQRMVAAGEWSPTELAAVRKRFWQ